MSVRQNGVIIAGSGSGSVDIDNSTITKNSMDEIQASAVINQNSGIVKTWKGTLAQYNALATHATDTVYVITDDQALDIIPSGMIMPYAGTTIPQGYLLCDGSAVSRTTYANLFTAIGTTYGAGDGNTTFNLPNLMDKLPWKSIMGSPGQSNKGILPKIEGHFTLFATYGGGGSSGALNASWSGSTRSPNNVSGTGDMRVTFAASRSSSAYTGLTDDVVPSVLFVGGYIIKY